MPLHCPITNLNIEEAIKTIKSYSGDQFRTDMDVVFRFALSDQKRTPSLKLQKKITNIPCDVYAKRWVDYYLKGYKSRPSVKIAVASKVFPDSIIPLLYKTLMPEKTDQDIAKEFEAHARLMNIENLTGELLEEYLAIKLKSNSWFCAWGSTIDAVDFCHTDGHLLQIKNSNNSENSSSSRVRNNTKIKKWFRRNSTKDNSYNWAELIKITGVKDISESDFRNWSLKVISNNSKILYQPIKTSIQLSTEIALPVYKGRTNSK